MLLVSLPDEAGDLLQGQAALHCGLQITALLLQHHLCAHPAGAAQSIQSLSTRRKLTRLLQSSQPAKCMTMALLCIDDPRWQAKHHTCTCGNTVEV